MCAAVMLCLVLGQVPQSLPRLLLQLSPAAGLLLSPPAHPRLPTGLTGTGKGRRLPLPLSCLAPWSFCSSIPCTSTILLCLISALRLQPGDLGPVGAISHSQAWSGMWEEAAVSAGSDFAWEAVQDFTDENILAERAKKARCFSLVSPIQLWFSAVPEQSSAGVRCSQRAC